MLESTNKKIRKIGMNDASILTLSTDESYGNLSHVAIHPNGEFAYISDSAKHRLLQINLTHPYAVNTIAGTGSEGSRDGKGTTASFHILRGLDVSKDGNFLFVTDSNNHIIRKLKMSTGDVSTVAGVAGRGDFYDGIGSSAFFKTPSCISVDKHKRRFCFGL